jgi:hypothetical protein
MVLEEEKERGGVAKSQARTETTDSQTDTHNKAGKILRRGTGG